MKEKDNPLVPISFPVGTFTYDVIGEYDKAALKAMKKSTNLPPPPSTIIVDDSYMGTGLSWDEIVFLLSQTDIKTIGNEDLLSWIKKMAPQVKSAHNEAKDSKVIKKAKEPKPIKPKEFNRFDIDI